MGSAAEYFGDPNPAGPRGGEGRFIDLFKEVDPVVFVPGLEFRPALGRSTMLNSVHFDPHTVAPLHAHEEEQITLVVEGELEFELDGDVRRLGPGMVVVVPSNVPHGARTHEVACQEYDIFTPHRRALLELRRRDGPLPEG